MGELKESHSLERPCANPSQCNSEIGRQLKFLVIRVSENCERGQRKGATSKKSKSSKSVKANFDIFDNLAEGKARQKSSKSVKSNTHFSTIFAWHQLSDFFLGGGPLRVQSYYIHISVAKSWVCKHNVGDVNLGLAQWCWGGGG